MDLGLGSLQRIVFRTGRHEVVGWLHLLVFISNLNHTLGEFGFWVGGRWSGAWEILDFWFWVGYDRDIMCSSSSDNLCRKMYGE